MIPTYTLTKTLALGITLVLLTYLFYYLFRRLKIKINEKWITVSFLWVLFAAFVRVSEDMGVYPNSFFTVSPGILITLSLIIAPLFFVSYFLDKKYKIKMELSLSTFAIVGIILHIPFFTNLNNVSGAVIIVSLALLIFAVLIAID